MSHPVGLPTQADVLGAAKRLAGHAVRTPLLRNDVLDAQLGCKLFVKAECLQRTGSFKFRGAFNRISQLTDDEKRRGILAYSSGNHAQGIAAAAKINGTTAKILMPADAPRSKVEGVLFWGGQVVTYDRASESREAIGETIAKAERRVLVPPYEDRDVIAGQGTAGLEAAQQMQALGETPDVVVCCAGGGGLIAGVGLAMHAAFPGVGIWAAEPEGFDDHKRSLASGQRETNGRLTGSICDAIITPTPGALTWALNSTRLAGGAAISDDEVLEAMAAAWRHLKIVVEPGGAAALAAVLSGKIEVAGKTVCVLATGGNVDATVFQRALERA